MADGIFLEYEAQQNVHLGREQGRTGILVHQFDHVYFDGTTVKIIKTGDVFESRSFQAAIDAGIFLFVSGPGARVHDSLDLIHMIDDGPVEWLDEAYFENAPAGDPFPTSRTWYHDNTKARKIVEKLITRDEDQFPTTIVWNLYDSDGTTVITTVTDVFTYDGPQEVSRARTITYL